MNDYDAVRIYDSEYGEVQLKEWFDTDTNQSGLDVYIGDNFDDYIGEIHCRIGDDEEIDKQLREIL